jgi:hypothetical protein
MKAVGRLSDEDTGISHTSGGSVAKSILWVAAADGRARPPANVGRIGIGEVACSMKQEGYRVECM